MAIAQHLCLRLVNDAVIAASPAERRMLARVVLERARKASLIAFCQPDNHLHVVVGCSRDTAGHLAQAVTHSLRARLGLEARFAPPFIKPIVEARHLNAAFRYVLRQPDRHGVSGDSLREASNLPDLLGLREIGSYTRVNVRRSLPRMGRRDLLQLLGVDELRPAEEPLERVIDAALAAAALPSLEGSTGEAISARRAVLAVVSSRLPCRTLAALLGISARSVQWLRARAVDPAMVMAIRLQLDLLSRLPAEALRAEAPFAHVASALHG